MGMYNEASNLTKAEAAYLRALELYLSIKDKRMCGNVWDGLSYCYILKKEFEKAEKASLEALKIDEYDTPNKHSNYISSLLCQKKQTEAILYYNSLLEKESVKKQLLEDWKSEMQGVGINTDNFREIFNNIW
jgi:tetratricopeptide (TPR) repeat protein